MRILTHCWGPTFECRINHRVKNIKNMPQFCRKNAEMSYSFIFQKVFLNPFLFNIYTQKTTELSFRECIHGIITNISCFSFEGNTIYGLTFRNLYIYTKYMHLSNKVGFGIGQNDFTFLHCAFPGQLLKQRQWTFFCSVGIQDSKVIWGSTTSILAFLEEVAFLIMLMWDEPNLMWGFVLLCPWIFITS